MELAGAFAVTALKFNISLCSLLFSQALARFLLSKPHACDSPSLSLYREVDESKSLNPACLGWERQGVQGSC